MWTDRYLLTGTLRTEAPLHLGSGEVAKRKGLTYKSPVGGTDIPIEVNAVAVDHKGRAYIPGTALKGVLRRSWERSFGSGSNQDDGSLFGSQERGGDAEFQDAFLEELPEMGEEWKKLWPYWCQERGTAVVSRAAIDRVTGTASHHRLFHDEIVPPGLRFEVRIAGRFSEEEALRLLALLQGFDGTDQGLALGADTVNGWGACSWEPGEIRRMTVEDAKSWLAGTPSAAGWEVLQPVPGAERERLLNLADEMAGRGARPELTFRLQLDIPGPFLVNEPARTGEGEDKPDHTPRLDRHGRPFLPATSFRGALRSQAERILRTIRGEDAVCGPGAPRPLCAPPLSEGDLDQLCPACKIFGAAGWRSPVRVSSFRTGFLDQEGSEPRPVPKPERQEFLAIDRFTGGGAPGLKFNAEAAYGSELHGTMSVDLEALERAGAGPWSLALLALVLRDLVEGDISFGFGAAKGYGHATATVQAVEAPPWDSLPEPMRTMLEEAGVQKEDLAVSEGGLTRDNPLGQALLEALRQLQEVTIPPPAPREASASAGEGATS